MLGSDGYSITSSATANIIGGIVMPSAFAEAVLLGIDGRSDFNGLHSRKHNQEVEFYAFDILVSGRGFNAANRRFLEAPFESAQFVLHIAEIA